MVKGLQQQQKKQHLSSKQIGVNYLLHWNLSWANIIQPKNTNNKKYQDSLYFLLMYKIKVTVTLKI